MSSPLSHKSKYLTLIIVQVLVINEFQKSRFTQNMIREMFDNVRGKKIAVFGFAFKKDTGDTRESPAIDVVGSLVEERAITHIYDPKVKATQIMSDLNDYMNTKNIKGVDLNRHVVVESDVLDAVKGAHAIAVLTEWEAFTKFDYEKFYAVMETPSFIFDGRNILNHEQLTKIGFKVYAIGKGK